MQKTLLTLAIIVLSSLTALGQPSLSPKRIVFNGDTGVFFIRKQEVALLQLIKQGEGYKKENVQLLNYQINCDQQSILERAAFASLFSEYTELNSVATDFQAKYTLEWQEHQKARAELEKQVSLKIRWRKTSLWLGASNIALATGIYFIVKN